MKLPAVSGHATSVESREPRDARRATNVERALALLRKAVTDRRYSLDALAAAMDRKGSYKSQLSRVLNGEATLTLDFVSELPDDVQALWYQFRAESFGLVVVEQVDEDTARRQLAAGLMSLFALRAAALPVKAERMAYSEAEHGERRKRA